VGYTVVEVTHEKVPAAQAGPRTNHSEGRSAPPAPPRVPSAPLSYRVVQIAEETTTEQERAPAGETSPWLRATPRKPPSLLVCGALAISCSVLMCALLALAVSVAETAQPGASWTANSNAFPPEEVVWGEKLAEPPNDPAPRQVILPDAPAAPAPEGPGKLAGLFQGLGTPAKDGCKPGEVGAPPADRETFGTAVAFARNPREAARSAAEERKLTFHLHVSGNFEEARFT